MTATALTRAASAQNADDVSSSDATYATQDVQSIHSQSEDVASSDATSVQHASALPVLQGDLADPSEFALAEDAPLAVVRTGIRGRVRDQDARQPVLDALIVAVGTPARTRSDTSGHFALDLAPGTYTIRVYYPGFRTIRLERVRVTAGASTELTVELPTDRNQAPLGQRVAGRADRATAATQLAIRRQSASVQDGVSAQEIARAPDAAASDAVRRVVGVSIAEGRYAVVRGLGGRYVNALLNGVPLPPSDPDVPGVQLDVFPASLLTSLNVVKSFMPELMGDWAGGSILISTRDYPERLTLSASVSLGFDTLTHVQQPLAHQGLGALSYQGGSLDALGLDDGTRALPRGLPSGPLALGQNGLSREGLTQAAQLFPVQWAIVRDLALPNGSASLQVGNTSTLFGRPLGYLLALSYGATTRARQGPVARTRLEGEGAQQRAVAREQGLYEATQRDIQWGVLGTLAFRPAPDHDLSLVTLFNQATSDEAGFRTGYSEDAGSDLITRVQRYVQRSLVFSQLNGDHRWGTARSIRLRWSGFVSGSSRTEPDTRFFKYSLEEPSRPRAAFGTGGIDRIYTALSQLEGGASLDFSAPIGPLVLRTGAMSRLTGRDFIARRFTYEQSPTNDLTDLANGLPNEILARENIGQRVEIREYTQRNDSYQGQAQYVAPFARLDARVLDDRLRIAGGARVEYYRQHVLSYSPFAQAESTACRTHASETGELANCTDRVDVDVLPALGLTYEIHSTMALRANYGATVGRPLFRELAPFLFPDVVRNRLITGNPTLRTARIHNVDLRWEYFASSQEVIAVTAFAKSFADPIESVSNGQGSSSSLTFCNANRAVVLGGEVEARISMGRIHPRLQALSLAANVALSWSELTIQPDACGDNATFLLTNTRRPLGGQSPIVANVVLGFAPTSSTLSAYLFYNAYAARLEEAGSFGLPDVYQDTFHQLDAAVNWTPSARFSLRFAAKNLLGQSVTLRQGDVVVEERSAGASFAVRAQLQY
ncbi:MAG: TonB-dependent receptor [Deltaproteobacteria bacterium]|nr:TonB-dependent receptor [Deltaproteobacteria bacterium]